MAPRICIEDPGVKRYRYTAIDEYSCYRSLGASSEQSTYLSADFLRRMAAAFARKGVKVKCVQTDNGFEFTNRFSTGSGIFQRLRPATTAGPNIFAAKT